MRLISMIAVLACMPLGAMAQGANCGPTDEVLARLGETFRERPVWFGSGAGTGAAGRVIIITGDPDQTSFSIVVASPDGIACMVAAGHNWSSIAALPAPEGEES